MYDSYSDLAILLLKTLESYCLEPIRMVTTCLHSQENFWGHIPVTDLGFPRQRGANPWVLGKNLLFDTIFADNYMKMKEFLGEARPWHPLGSVNAYYLNSDPPNRVPEDGYYMFTLVIQEDNDNHCTGSLMRTPASDPSDAIMLCRAKTSEYAW